MPLGVPDLAPVSVLFSSPVTRRRYGTPALTAEYLLSDPVPTDTEGLAHPWPVSGATLERLGEGVEGQEVWEGTTTLELVAEDPSTVPPTRGDSLIWAQAGAGPAPGVEYQVIESSPRKTGPGGVVTWRSFVAVRLDPGALY